MPSNSRRRLLQGLTVVFPAACYAMYDAELGSNFSFTWPGGGGAHSLDIHDGFDCGGEVVRTTRVVLADSATAAADLAGPCPGGQVLEQISVFAEEGVPSLPEGCSFYWCVVIN